MRDYTNNPLTRYGPQGAMHATFTGQSQPWQDVIKGVDDKRTLMDMLQIMLSEQAPSRPTAPRPMPTQAPLEVTITNKEERVAKLRSML